MVLEHKVHPTMAAAFLHEQPVESVETVRRCEFIIHTELHNPTIEIL